MKNVLIVLFSIFFGSHIFSQNRKKGDWLILKDARTNLIGKEVGKIIKKNDNTYEINTIDGTTNTGVDDYVIRKGSNEKNEIEKYYRSIYTKYFTKEKNLDIKITAKNVKIYDLNMNGFDKVGYNKKVIVSGVSADTINVAVSIKKEYNTDVAKITNDIISLAQKAYGGLPSELKEVVKIDSFSVSKKDSLVFNYKIYDNKVLYKVKVAKVKLVNSKMRTNYGKIFWANSGDVVHLSKDMPTSPKKYGEWWGLGSNVGGQTWISYESSTGKLFGHYEKIIKEIPITGPNYWDVKHFMTTENKGNKSKMIIIAVYAFKEEDKLKIHQRREGDLATYLHYPEFKYKWY